MQDAELLSYMRRLYRQRLHWIWQQVKQGENLDNPEGARLGKVMKEHPEYYDYWEKAGKGKGRLVADEKGANPHLYVLFEAALEAQLESGEIPEVRQALWFLVENGMEKHQARHAILKIMVDETWHVLREKRAFDIEGYKISGIAQMAFSFSP